MLIGYVEGLYSKALIESWSTAMLANQYVFFEDIGSLSLHDVLEEVGHGNFNKKIAKQLVINIKD